MPVVEFYFNEERMSIFESVISLVNAFNKAISEKANDVDYFSDQYLAFLGAAVEEEDLKTFVVTVLLIIMARVRSEKCRC